MTATPQGGDPGFEASPLPVDADSELSHLDPRHLWLPCRFEAVKNRIARSGRRSSDCCAKQGDNTKTTDRRRPERSSWGWSSSWFQRLYLALEAVNTGLVSMVSAALDTDL